MKGTEDQLKFIAYRAEGRSYASIAGTLEVSKQTLIEWGRKFQFEISNLRMVAAEAVQEKYVAAREARLSFLSENITRLEAELATRDLTKIPTAQLFSVVAQLRAQLKKETVDVQFASPTREIPDAEFTSSIVEWRA